MGARCCRAASGKVSPKDKDKGVEEVQPPTPRQENGAPQVDVARDAIKDEEPLQPPGTVPEVDTSANAMAVANTEDTDGPELPKMRLTPVEATEADVQGIFERYALRVDDVLAKTLNSTWEKLQAEIEASKEGSSALEWFWILEDCESGLATPEGAIGLVVFRVVKGAFNSHVMIAHLSVAGPLWKDYLPVALAAVREDMMRTLPIAGVRVMLMCQPDDKGKMVLNPACETPFKGGDYRWFTLSNTADGKRGQIMLLRRNEEKDPPCPDELLDLSIKLCTFVPVLPEEDKEAAAAEVAKKGSPRRRPVGNRLVIAECLRRHFTPEGLAQAPSSEEAPAAPESTEAAATPAEAEGPKPEEAGETTAPGEAGEAEAKEAEADDTDKTEGPKAEEPGSRIADIVERLGDKKNLNQVLFSSAEKVEDCDSFCTGCLAGSGVQVPTEVLSLLGTHLREQPRFSSILCGSTGLSVNMQQLPAETDSPSNLRLPVAMLGTTKKLNSPICYVRTEDEQVFIIAWQIPEGEEEAVQERLYPYCYEVLHGALLEEDGLLFDELVLPRFKICCFASADAELPPSLRQRLCPPCELMAVEVSGGRPRPGVLKPPPQSEPRKTCTIKSSFVFCLWHAKLDDLDVPLFATVVTEADCSPVLA